MPPAERPPPTSRLSPISRAIIAGAALLTLLVFVYGFRVNALLIRSSFPDDVQYYLPPAKYAPVLSLGYREAAADLTWVAVIQHASDGNFYHGKRFPYLERYLDTIITLNPYLFKLYLWADGTITYARGKLTDELWQLTIRYLEIGHRYFPESWELLFKLSCAYTEMEPPDRAQRSRNRRRAADYLWKAHLVGGGPSWLGSLAARYWSDEGQWMLAFRRALEEYQATDNPEVKAGMERRLADLLGRSSTGTTMVDRFARLGVPTAANPGGLALFLVGEGLQQRLRSAETAAYLDTVSAHKDAFDQAHRRCLPYGSSHLFAILGECERLANPLLPRDTWDASPTTNATVAPEE